MKLYVLSSSHTGKWTGEGLEECLEKGLIYHGTFHIVDRISHRSFVISQGTPLFLSVMCPRSGVPFEGAQASGRGLMAQGRPKGLSRLDELDLDWLSP